MKYTLPATKFLRYIDFIHGVQCLSDSVTLLFVTILVFDWSNHGTIQQIGQYEIFQGNNLKFSPLQPHSSLDPWYTNQQNCQSVGPNRKDGYWVVCQVEGHLQGTIYIWHLQNVVFLPPSPFRVTLMSQICTKMWLKVKGWAKDAWATRQGMARESPTF